MMGRVKSRKFAQLPILAKMTFILKKKGTKNFSTPYLIPFLSVLNQNKTLLNFQKGSQHLTFGRSAAACIDKIDGDAIKAIKIITGSLDAAFELTKVIKCSMFLKS